MSAKITLSEAKNLHKAYLDDKRTLLESGLRSKATLAGGLSNKEESKHCHISLSDLKNYIADIETKASACNLDLKDLGLDIYFGAYPDTHVNAPDQLTAFFVPTLENSSGTKEGFVYTNNNGNLGIERLKNVTDINMTHEELSILNNIGMTPPPGSSDTDMDCLIENVD